MSLIAAATSVATALGLGTSALAVGGTAAAMGAAGGAALGAGTSALMGGDPGQGALFGAAGGALTGGLSGALGGGVAGAGTGVAGGLGATSTNALANALTPTFGSGLGSVAGATAGGVGSGIGGLGTTGLLATQSFLTPAFSSGAVPAIAAGGFVPSTVDGVMKGLDVAKSIYSNGNKINSLFNGQGQEQPAPMSMGFDSYDSPERIKLTRDRQSSMGLLNGNRSAGLDSLNGQGGLFNNFNWGRR